MSPPFINISELEEHEGRLSLLDARSERAYATAHLPGAVNLPARDLNAPVDGVRQLVSAGDLEVRLHDLGVGKEPVVVYGAKGGSDAAHVWWTLHAYSHPNVFLLDGGIEAWQMAGLELRTDASTPKPLQAEFKPKLQPKRLIDQVELKVRLHDRGLAVIDTRSPGEYTGEDAFAERGGHIPGAHLFSWSDALTEAGELKADAVLTKDLKVAMDAPEVVLYCQSGVRAAHTYAVLHKLGHPYPRLYLGSWGEWGNQEDTPIAKGEEKPPQEVTP
jgi:thiosulfate/3-mercaptopyruvate sulfurtransferase